MAETTSVIADAYLAADTAARDADVTMRILDRVQDFSQVVELLQHIWKGDVSRPPVNVETLRAVSKAGSYVGGAFRGDEMVGAGFGFFGPPERRSLHSHIAGVRAGSRGRNVGFAIKTHQRAWALEHHIDEISWTFDPLISRNAYFNLVKLGATASEYLENFYGQMSDDLNGSDDTDRLLVTWKLWDPQVAAASRGDYVSDTAAGIPALLRPDGSFAPQREHSDAQLVAIGLPRDIETIRRENPTVATAWRLALRETLGAALVVGGTVIGFDRDGNYIVNRGKTQ